VNHLVNSYEQLDTIPDFAIYRFASGTYVELGRFGHIDVCPELLLLPFIVSPNLGHRKSVNCFPVHLFCKLPVDVAEFVFEGNLMNGTGRGLELDSRLYLHSLDPVDLQLREI